MNSCAIFSLRERLFITESTHWVDCGVEGLDRDAVAFAQRSGERAIAMADTKFLKKGEVVIYRGKLSLRFSFNVFYKNQANIALGNCLSYHIFLFWVNSWILMMNEWLCDVKVIQ